MAIQDVAARSWPGPVTFMGEDEGTSEWSQKLGARHIRSVACNEWGTPLVSDVFRAIREDGAPDDVCCYINADIVLDGEAFEQTVETCAQTIAADGQRCWLLVGKRTDLDSVTIGCVQDILNAASVRGVDHGWDGIDYFVFPRATFPFVYPFALGKFVWDQWLVGNAHRRGLVTVDCSRAVLAVHLNCPWYIDGGVTSDHAAVYDSVEGARNRSFDYYQKNILTGTEWTFDFEGGLRRRD